MKKRNFKVSAQNYVFQFWSGIISSVVIPSPLRPALLRFTGAKIGRDTHLSPNVTFKNFNLTIGDGCVIGMGTYCDCTGKVELQERVHVSPNVQILSVAHRIMPSVYRRSPDDVEAKGVIIARGCWIGAGSIILSGVKIGEGCVVAAGSVVTRDCAPNGLYLGVPARRVRDLDLERERT